MQQLFALLGMTPSSPSTPTSLPIRAFEQEIYSNNNTQYAQICWQALQKNPATAKHYTAMQLIILAYFQAECRHVETTLMDGAQQTVVYDTLMLLLKQAQCQFDEEATTILLEQLSLVLFDRSLEQHNDCQDHSTLGPKIDQKKQCQIQACRAFARALKNLSRLQDFYRMSHKLLTVNAATTGSAAGQDSAQRAAQHVSSFLVSLFSTPQHASHQDYFLLFFVPTYPYFTEAQAWANVECVRKNPELWRHLIKENVLSAWFALTFLDTNRCYDLLNFVYRYYRPILLASQLLIPTLGLSAAARDNMAKLAIKKMVAYRRSDEFWMIFLNLHQEFLIPMYASDVDALQSFIDSLTIQKVIEFWTTQQQHLPQFAALLLASKAVRLQGGVDILLAHCAFKAAAVVGAKTIWLQVQNDIVQALSPSANHLPQVVEEGLCVVLAQADIAQKLDLPSFNAEHILAYLCDARRMEKWDGILAVSPHLIKVLQEHARFSMVVPAYFPQTHVALSQRQMSPR